MDWRKSGDAEVGIFPPPLVEKLTQRLHQTSADLPGVVTGSLYAGDNVPGLIGTFSELGEP